MLEKRDVRATGPRNEIDFSNKRELVAKGTGGADEVIE